MIISVKLTVFFNDPFWIGIFESYNDKSYKACKVTFGAEPRDDEVYDFLLKNYYKLNFSSEEKLDKKMVHKKENPKRVQRAIRKEVKGHGASTKAQEIIKMQYEENKAAHKKLSKEKKEEREKRLYELKQKKKKEKHKGH